MNQLMASIQDAIQTTEMAKNSKPQFMTEGEWFQFLKNHPEDAVINGDDQPPVEG
jgi:hypothetical protein